MGHEDAFPPPRLSVRCGFSQRTFARTRSNVRDAPIPVIRITAADPGIFDAERTLAPNFCARRQAGCKHPPRTAEGVIKWRRLNRGRSSDTRREKLGEPPGEMALCSTKPVIAWS